MMKEIPLLRANDIECRVQQVRKTFDGKIEAILLLYKDARCDMKYLDMLYGPTGWQRSHRLIGDRLYCTVQIWDDERGQWISKEDVGTESNTEKEKGQASDSFKRACFNIGIGRELYTAPSIKIELKEREYSEDGGKYKTYATFKVRAIEYNKDREISRIEIVDRFDNLRFSFVDLSDAGKTPRERLIAKLKEKNINITEFAKENNISNSTTAERFEELLKELGD